MSRIAAPADCNRSYLVRAAFDGTAYVGWQYQPNGLSVQEALETSFEKVTQQPVRLRGAGRTDAGVHALDLPADFTLPFDLDLPRLLTAWNAVTPPDITIHDIRRVPEGFSARHRAHRRHYRYVVLNRPFPSPFLSRYSWHITDELDIISMQQAMVSLVGEHDFSAFRAASCEAAHPVRRIVTATVHDMVTVGAWERHADWWPFAGSVEGGLLCFTISGTAFLKHQVRAIVGTLALVGRGKVTPGEFADILALRDRSCAGPTAPAHGLTLVGVAFPPDALGDSNGTGAQGAGGGTE
ncbi:MAG: tRNA pseudouridine(38-40) synthase TruA [Candidatus Lernaella stagnicola]|nr:tRNA pseudouridine(38-40) synthase TruA [Candidatus Lernaella stagnicola]